MNLEDLLNRLKEKKEIARINLPHYIFLTKEFLQESNEVMQFYLRTNYSQRVQMEQSLDTFSADLLDYLREITPLGFKPVHPTPSQLNNIQLILESAETDSLIHNYTKKHVKNSNIGMLKRYNSPIHNTQEIRTSSYIVHWNLNTNQPSMAVLSGKKGEDFQMMTLFFSPHKITTPEQIKGTGLDFFYSGHELETRIFDNANRIDNHFTVHYKGEIIEQRNTCYYVGSFESLTTRKEHHVYAHNDNDKQTRYLPVGSKQLHLAHEST